MTEQLEGRISILAALEARQRTFEALLVSRTAKTEKLDDVLSLARKRGVPVRTVDESELGAQSKTHGGIVALCGPKPMTSPEELHRIVGRLKTPPFLVLLDGADDPRDLGMILRSAEAFGVHAVLLRRRAWDMDSTAVSRASSGSFERMPIALVEQELEELLPMRKNGIQMIGLHPAAKTSLYQTDMTGPLILAIGGEKRGLSNAVRSRCQATVRIPTRPEPSSLSMTQAAAIALGEIARQRSS